MAYRTITIKLANGQTITKRIDERGIVPAGGTSGQSLNKQSDTDFDVDWSDATDPRLTDSKNPHGHLTYDDTFTTLSFDESTRTVTITPVPTLPLVSPLVFKYYIDSIAYETGEQSVVFDDTEGTWFFYLDHDGLLYATQSFDVAGEHAFVAALYWDATNNLIIYEANERHSVAFDHADWKYKHLTFGTQWRSGSGMTGITADGDGDVDSSATFTVEHGVIDDEDIRHLLPQSTTYDIFYKLGVNGDWRRSDIGTAYGVHYDGTRATYNQFTGGAWQLTTVANLDYVLAHVFATNNLLSPYIVVMGQGDYGTLTAAREGANVEMNNLITVGLPFQEFVPVATLIYQTANTYDNDVRSRIRSTDTGDDYVNWLGQELSPTITPAAHNNLTGLQLAGTGVIYGHIDESIFNLIPTVDQNDAIDGANSPSASNVFITTSAMYETALPYFGKAYIHDNAMDLPTSRGEKIYFATGMVIGSPAYVVNTFNLSSETGRQIIIRFIDETGMQLSSTGGNLGFDAIVPSTYYEIKCEYDGLKWQLIDSSILTDDQLAAITGANNPSVLNVFATMDDLSGGETYVAGYGIEITPGSPDNIISVDPSIIPESGETYAAGAGIEIIPGSPDNIIKMADDQILSGDVIDAINGANSPSVYNPFATMSDIPDDELTADQLAAITGADTPSASNVFATIKDLAEIISNNADNRVVTGSSTPGSLNGETNLTFDGSLLTVTGNIRITGIAGDASNWLISDASGNISIGSIAASETVSGVVELATQAEVNTGTDATRVITPATLKGSTNIPAVTNNADNRVITGGSGQALNGESSLTFNGTTLGLTGSEKISGTLTTLGLILTRTVISSANDTLANSETFAVYDYAGNSNLYLPASPLTGEVHIIANATTAYTCTIQGNGKNIFDNGATYSSRPAGNRQSWIFIYNGTEWNSIAFR